MIRFILIEVKKWLHYITFISVKDVNCLPSVTFC